MTSKDAHPGQRIWDSGVWPLTWLVLPGMCCSLPDPCMVLLRIL